MSRFSKPLQYEKNESVVHATPLGGAPWAIGRRGRPGPHWQPRGLGALAGWQQGGPQQARRREHPGLRVEAGGSNDDSAQAQLPGQVLSGAQLCAQLPAEHRNIIKAHIDREALWRDACSPNSTSVALLASEGGLTLRKHCERLVPPWYYRCAESTTTQPECTVVIRS